MINKFHFLVLARVLIGVLFIYSGFVKLIQPYENFLFVIQNYEILNEWIEVAVARFFPWMELFVGTFLLLGLWLKPALSVLWLMNTTFIIVVGQALVRRLPIDDCGCFGDWISIPLKALLLMDLGIWILCALMVIFIRHATVLSLDRYFNPDFQ